jgi:hypothetical protein
VAAGDPIALPSAVVQQHRSGFLLPFPVVYSRVCAGRAVRTVTGFRLGILGELFGGRQSTGQPIRACRDECARDFAGAPESIKRRFFGDDAPVINPRTVSGNRSPGNLRKFAPHVISRSQ